MFNGFLVTLQRFPKIIKAQQCLHLSPTHLWNVPPQPELDLEYLLNDSNSVEIGRNIFVRKAEVDLQAIKALNSKRNNTDTTSDSYRQISKEFFKEALKVPNKTHGAVSDLGENPAVIKYVGEKPVFSFKPREFYEISKRLNLVRSEHLGSVCGNRSYVLMGQMAEIEQALVKYTLRRLIDKGFMLISVPDVVHRDIIEGCGVNTTGTRAMVYTLDPGMHGPDLCLSGTSEMALAGHFINKVVSKVHLPLKLVAVSRCFRAEVSSVAEERGIYRVHQFTKVEMFALSEPHKSDDLLEEFREIEEENFSALGLHLRTLDMPPHELGPPAYRKYDIEAWLPGRDIFGEISSCSNCTDYQARRLNIKYKLGNELKHVHTLNGTACAVPRMLIALIETYQTDKGIIPIPEVLQQYLHRKTYISKQKSVPPLKLAKNKKR